MSPVPDPLAWGVNALSLSWEDLDPYTFPPAAILGKVVKLQESFKPKSTSMSPRATAIKEQGFSEAAAAQIEAPQRGSTRSVYEGKFAIFTKWCLTNQVDFRAPPTKSVTDFLMYLFQDRKLQPSTIDGYRSLLINWEIHPLMSVVVSTWAQ